jgi:hypothetical protein
VLEKRTLVSSLLTAVNGVTTIVVISNRIWRLNYWNGLILELGSFLIALTVGFSMRRLKLPCFLGGSEKKMGWS